MATRGTLVTTKLPPDLVEQIDALGKAEGITRSGARPEGDRDWTRDTSDQAQSAHCSRLEAAAEALVDQP